MLIVQVHPKLVAGIFAENSDGKPATDLRVWRASDNAERFVQDLKSLQTLFGSSRNRVWLGKDLMNHLFPRDRYPDADANKQVDIARQQFVKFVATSGGPAPFDRDRAKRLFARMILTLPQPTLYPLGLLAPSSAETSFVGYHVRIESPLSRQHFAAAPGCIHDWQGVLPTGGDKALGLAYGRIQDDLATPPWGLPAEVHHGRLVFPFMADMARFGVWLDPGDDATRAPRKPLVLAVLSHHDLESVFFDAREPVHATAVTAPFTAPSVAILSNCSSATVGASGFVDALNLRNVDAVIATNTGIGGELAGDFMACVWDEYVTAGADAPVKIGDLFERAQRCLYRKQPDYGPQVLSFSFAGNPHVQLCSLRGN